MCLDILDINNHFSLSMCVVGDVTSGEILRDLKFLASRKSQ